MSTHTPDHLKTIYRNYDIRGEFGKDFTAEDFKKIAYTFVTSRGLKQVAVGYDERPSTPALREAIIAGASAAGASVFDLGKITTPMSYFACGKEDTDACFMITASHLPAAHNGLKITVDDARPLSTAEIKELETLVAETTVAPVEQPGTVVARDITSEWIAASNEGFQFKNIYKIGVDPANMIGILELATLRANTSLEVLSIHDEMRADSPAHEANPMNYDTLKDLQALVVDQGLDIGVAFDGDADRIGFVDETGAVISADLIACLLVKTELADHPAPVIIDPRSTKAVAELVQELGGTPIECKVGHTNIRAKMRETDAVLGIESSAHFFYRWNNFSEAGCRPLFQALHMMDKTGKTLSELIAEVQRYHHSGEINSEIKRPVAEILDELRQTYSEGAVSEIDGLKVSFDDWWFNVRASGTEPLIRLNLESNSQELTKTKVQEILKIITS